MKNILKIVLISILFIQNFTAQNVENHIVIDTLYKQGKLKSNINQIIFNFPKLCCVEEYESNIKKENIYNPFPILKDLGILKSKYKNFRISSIIIASLCNNCNEVSYQVGLFEFCLASEDYAKKLLLKINKLDKKQNYTPFGKNWFFKRKGSKVYFLQAFAEDKINNTKVELSKRINSLK